MTEPLRWTGLEESAPDVATRARRVIEEWGFMLLGTIRRDGTPRISPAETHLVDDHLALALIPQSCKARDVMRDPRITLQSPVATPDTPGTELKIRGTVVAVDDREARRRIGDTVQRRSGWRPALRWLFVRVAVESLAILEWREGDMALTRWDPHHGIRGPEVRRLDVNAGAYVRSP